MDKLSLSMSGLSVFPRGTAHKISPSPDVNTPKPLDSFHGFLELPPELRNHIYEYMVYVENHTDYEAYDKCSCGLSSTEDNHPPTCTFVPFEPPYGRMYGMFHLRDVSKFYSLSRPLPLRSCTIGMGFKPGILEVSRQVREEAMPIFYAGNDFVFDGDCEGMVNNWIFHAVQPKHWRHINSITIQHGTFSGLLTDPLLPIDTLLVLLEQGHFGQCSLQIDTTRHPVLTAFLVHTGCILRQAIKWRIAIFSEWKPKPPAFVRRDGIEQLAGMVVKEFLG